MTTLTGAPDRLRNLIEDNAGDTPLYLIGRDRNRSQLYAWFRPTSSWIPVPDGGASAATITRLLDAEVFTLTRIPQDELPPELAAAIRRHETKAWRGLGTVRQIHLHTQTPAPASREFPRRAFPCGPCPIRSDNTGNPNAKFPAERWEVLSRTVPNPDTGMPPIPGEIMFGCHKGKPGSDEYNPGPGDDLACAGWLVRFGRDHLGIRMALMDGRLPATALEPGPNWPPLHETWDDVVRHQTSDTGACAIED